MDDWPHPELDAAEVLRALGRHEVDYVLIGGLALAMYGSNQLTFDIDLVPAAGRLRPGSRWGGREQPGRPHARRR